MNVYAIKASGFYGGGMSVVAANSAYEAQQLAQAEENSVWDVQYRAPEMVELLSVRYAGPPRVLVHFETGE